MQGHNPNFVIEKAAPKFGSRFLGLFYSLIFPCTNWSMRVRTTELAEY